MSIDFLFLFLAVWLAMTASATRYRTISLILVADFCLFIGIDELWIASSVPGGEWILPYKGMIYLIFYLVYGFSGSLYLSVLSVFSAFYHFLAPLMSSFGIEWPINNYEAVMIGYCVMQLLGGFLGVCHEHINRHFPRFSWRRFTHSNH